MVASCTTGTRWGALAFGLLAWGLCGGGIARAADNMPETRNAVLVTAENQESTVKLTGKEHLLVVLKFRAGTGYAWKLKDAGKELHLMHHYVIRRADAPRVGGERVAAFDFAPAEEGTGDVVIELHAPGGKVEQTFKIAVQVEKAR